MTWTTRPSDFVVDVEDQLGKMRSDIGLFIHRGVVLKMPVDTGRARSSNNVSYTQPDRSATITSQDQAIAQGASRIASRAKSPYEILWIFNPLPYIGKLEFQFTSKQAPEGMYRITIASVKARYGR